MTLSFVSQGSSFGFVSSSVTGAMAAILNGMRTGAGVAPNVEGALTSRLSVSWGAATGVSTWATGAKGDAKEFGTDGPLEAGTLSDAGASVPFGESLKGIRLGDCGPWPFVEAAGAIFTIASAAASGSAAAKASAVGTSRSTE